MERKICKSMREFTRINRKRQMLMSHCSLRAIRHLPFLWVIGTSCSSGSGLLTWTFSTIRYSYSVSSSLLKLREGLNNVTSSLVHAVPYLKCMRAAGGIRLCGRAGRNRACSRANALRALRQTRTPLLAVFIGSSGTGVLHPQHKT